MTVLKKPLFSFDARGRLSKSLSYLKRRGQSIVEASPDPPDAKTLAQLSWRHMFQKVVALWHALTPDEKEAWESLGRRRHMTGYAWFVSQALRPNPGIYLPLQGGTMSGEIDMATNKISAVPDPVALQDADTKAARDAAIAAALAGSLHCDIYGYDGSNWQTLLVESAAQKNLRVRLYSGANAIEVVAGGSNVAGHQLSVAAGVRAWDAAVGAFRPIFLSYINSDNLSVPRLSLESASYLHGFDGATWDRLRTYGTGILKVGRAEIGASTIRRTNAGQVKASAGHLYWITMNPSAGNSVMQLSNDLDGSTPILYDHFHTSRQTHHVVLDPPMPFSTGIYLKTITNMTSIIFCYK